MSQGYLTTGLLGSVLFFGAVGSASASLVTVDTGVGVGTGLRDTASGNTWLQFGGQPALSFNQLVSLLATPSYAGFQLASSAQITTLINDVLAASGGDKNAAFFALTSN